MIICIFFCDMLGVDYLIMFVGMGGVFYVNVCVVVLEVGGFGIFGMVGVQFKIICE